MTHDDDKNPSRNVDSGTGTSSPDATAGAIAAAITAGLRKFEASRNRFKEAADEAANRVGLLAYLRYFALVNEEQEDAIRQRYPRAMLYWNQLEKRARAHGIAFSITAQAHHRAAVLDYLDNPGASTLIAHKHLTWFAPIRTRDLERNADSWRRYQEMCTPLRNRDIAHVRAVRGELTALRHLPSRHAASTVAAQPRPQP